MQTFQMLFVYVYAILSLVRILQNYTCNNVYTFVAFFIFQIHVALQIRKPISSSYVAMTLKTGQDSKSIR